MTRDKVISICFLFFLSTVFQSGAAMSDVVTPPYPYIAVQEEQNVKVTVRQKADWVDAYSVISMVRIQNNAETVVVSDVYLVETAPTEEVHTCGFDMYHRLDVNEFCNAHPEECVSCIDNDPAICVGTECSDCALSYDGSFNPRYFYGYNFCESFPEFKVDCDMDGVPECCLDCVVYFDFDFIDFCVPPESTEYRIRPFSVGSVAIDVVDAGIECEVPSTDEPLTTDDSETPDGSVASEETDSADSPDESESSYGPESSAETEDSAPSVSSDEVAPTDIPNPTDEDASSEESETADQEEPSDGLTTSDEIPSSDPTQSTDEPTSSDTPQPTDDIGSADEPIPSDDEKSSESAETTDSEQSSDEFEETDEMKPSDEEPEPTALVPHTKSESGCGVAYGSHQETAIHLRLIDILIRFCF
jgi:hypothetical protein